MVSASAGLVIPDGRNAEPRLHRSMQAIMARNINRNLVALIVFNSPSTSKASIV